MRPALLALLLCACGASGVTIQSKIDREFVLLTQQATAVRNQHRAAALDAIEAAHPDPAERNPLLDAESHRWDASAAALDAMTAGERAWESSIVEQLATGSGLPDLAPTVTNLLTLYQNVVQVLSDLHVTDLPALPQLVIDNAPAAANAILRGIDALLHGGL